MARKPSMTVHTVSHVALNPIEHNSSHHRCQLGPDQNIREGGKVRH